MKIQLTRTILTDDVRVTTFAIKWDENAPDEYPPEEENPEEATATEGPLVQAIGDIGITKPNNDDVPRLVGEEGLSMLALDLWCR